MRILTTTRLLLAGALAVVTSGVLAAPALAAPPSVPASHAIAATPEGTMTSAVDGTFPDPTGAVGTVTGTFAPSRFAVEDGTVVAVGSLHSVLTGAAGAPAGTADTEVTLPVQLPSGTAARHLAEACNILHL